MLSRERFKVMFLGTFILVLLVGLACPSSPVTAAEAPEKSFTVAFSPENLASPYWRTCLAGAEQAVKDINNHYGRDVLEIESVEYRDDPSLQMDHISAIIGAKERYSFYSAPAVVEEATVEPLRRLYEAGIPAFLWDRDTAPEGRKYRKTCIITNNVEVGKMEVQYLLEALRKTDKPKPYKIACAWGHPGASSAEDRKEGSLMALKPLVDTGEVEIVSEQAHEGWSRSLALDYIATVLAKVKLDAVFSSNDDMALGAIAAVKTAGLTPGKDVFIAGVDAIEEAQEAIKAGEMVVSIAQANYAMAYWSILAGFQHVAFDWEAPMSIIPAPVMPVTEENVVGFTLEVPLMDKWSEYGMAIEELPEKL
jgi:ABC-type sugar transport system substrate-binding protein